jgi:flagellar biosynthesis protein FlhB
MAEESFQDRTEKPTAKKLEKARSEGNVAKSVEVSSALILLTSLLVFFFAGSWMFVRLCEFMGGVFRNISVMQIDAASATSFLVEVLKQFLIVIMPLMVVALVAGIAGNIIQVGFLFTSKPLKMKLSKLNPISGIKNLISLKALVEVIKALIKFSCVGFVALLLLKREMVNFPALMSMGINDILAFIGKVSFDICLNVCLILILMAFLDFVYQKWQYQKNLMMTKQEIKEEYKQSEGDPKIKGKIKRIQFEIARRRMMDKVKTADVIITNPTHLAIALKYEHEKMMAPQLIAKGAGFIALKIKEIAQEYGIPIVENKDLARSLFKSVNLGEFVPVNLYKAVAEILAYVYRLKNRNQWHQSS